MFCCQGKFYLVDDKGGWTAPMYARDMTELSIKLCADITVTDVYGSVYLMLAANVGHKGHLY